MFLLGLARRLNAKVLIASTSEVYGDPGIHPQPESYWGYVNPIGKYRNIYLFIYLQFKLIILQLF